MSRWKDESSNQRQRRWEGIYDRISDDEVFAYLWERVDVQEGADLPVKRVHGRTRPIVRHMQALEAFLLEASKSSTPPYVVSHLDGARRESPRLSWRPVGVSQVGTA